MGGSVELAELSTNELEQLERTIAEERMRRIEQAAQYDQENQAARAYHEQVPAEKVDGFAVWVKPLAPIMGYPTGSVVHHKGDLWKNDKDWVNMTEPGTEESTWTLAEDVVL